MRQEPLSQEQVNELIALRLDDVLRCWLKSSQPLRSCVHLHHPSSRSIAVLANEGLLQKTMNTSSGISTGKWRSEEL